MDRSDRKLDRALDRGPGRRAGDVTQGNTDSGKAGFPEEVKAYIVDGSWWLFIGCTGW